MNELAPLPGFADCQPSAINSEGIVVGVSYSFGEDDTAATEWIDGNPIALGPLTSANGINDLGQVVGSISGSEYAVEWNDGTVVSLLGLSSAAAINNSEEVVGQTCGGTYCHAGRWIDGVATHLWTFRREAAARLLHSTLRGRLRVSAKHHHCRPFRSLQQG